MSLSEMQKRQAQQQKARAETMRRNITCPECGGRGYHWVEPGSSWLWSTPGFWTCPKFYGPDGRRINP